jgi:hypothetical protein
MNEPSLVRVVSGEDRHRTDALARPETFEGRLALWLAEVSADAAVAALHDEADPPPDQAAEPE